LRYYVYLSAGGTPIVPVPPPTAITRTGSGTITVPNNATAGTVIDTMTLTGGVGNGTWAQQSTFVDFGVTPTKGRTVSAIVAENLTGDAENGSRSLVFQYTGEGLASPLTCPIPISIVTPVSPPTDITASPTSSATARLAVAQNQTVPFTLATLTLVGGNAQGTWAKTSGSSKITLSAAGPGARTTDVKLTTALASGDVGTLDYVVGYTGDGLTTDLSETVFLNVTSVVAAPDFTATPATDLKTDSLSGATLITATVTGGAGTGAWSSINTITPALQADKTVSGRTATWKIGRDLTASDEGSFTFTITYTETGYSAVTHEYAYSIAKASGTTTGPPWRSGFTFSKDADSDPTTFYGVRSRRQRMEDWIGRRVLAHTHFLGAHDNEWNQFYIPDGDQWWALRNNAEDGVLTNCTLPLSTKKMITNGYPGLDKVTSSGMTQTTKDQIDLCGERIRDAVTFGSGASKVIKSNLVALRIGWEQTMAFGSYPEWSIRGPGNGNEGIFNQERLDTWKNGFNTIAGRLKAIIGSNVIINFCVQKDYKSHGYPIRNASGTALGSVPTGDYDPSTWTWIVPSAATHIAVDTYDSFPWATSKAVDGTDNYIDHMVKSRLAFQYARGHGLTFSIDEWGMRQKLKLEKGVYVCRGGADNAQFAEHMWKFLDECYNWPGYSGKLLWDCYFRCDNTFGMSSEFEDPVHSFCWYDTSQTPDKLRFNSPWHGKTDNVVTGNGGKFRGSQAYNATSPANSTGEFGARYKALFGA
jgi:hypothetical protein